MSLDVSMGDAASVDGGRSKRKKQIWPYKWQAGAAAKARKLLVQQYPKGSQDSITLWGPDYKEAAPYQRELRRALRYKGPGDYFTEGMKYGLRGLGAASYAGRQLYRKRGWRAAGRAAKRGYRAGARLSKAMGYGDYSVNQIVGSPGSMNPQQNIHHVSTVSSDLSGDIVYSNTEFVKNIYATITSGTSPFNVEAFSLNPALSETFPFLSQIAQNFELFEFQGLMFQYKPTSGEFGSNNSNALGKVILATNYDPDAIPFSSSVVMENYDYACSTKPSNGCIHGVECAPNQRATRQMYTRTGSSTKDKVFTDLGIFQIASEGIPSSVAQEVLIGELWVTYTVKLSRAKLYASLGESQPHGAFRGSTGTDLGAKTWTSDSSNSIAQVSTTPIGRELRFVDPGSNGQIDLEFGPGWAGSRIFITNLNYNTIAGSQTITASSVNNCTVVKTDSVESGTTDSMGQHIIDFDSAFVTATVKITYGSAPTATQIDTMSIQLVDPDFVYTF